MTPTVTVVIPHYYEQRRVRNLPILIDALNTGTVRPLEILIWNDARVPLGPFPNTHVILPHRAVGSKARYLAAMCAQGEYILFHDNDVCVEPKTIDTFLRYITEDTILSPAGRQVKDEFHGPMSDFNRVEGHVITKLTPVDIPHAKLSMSHRKVVNRLLGDLPFTDPDFEMDDVMYAAVAKHRGVGCFVYPWLPGEGYVLLSECGVGMWRDANFYKDRDKLVREHWPENFK